MIPKSGYRFSEKIMLKQKDKAKCRINLSPFRFGGGPDFDRHKASVAFRRLGRIPDDRAQQRCGSNKTQLFWRLQARPKRRLSLRLSQGCHNWGHNGLADGRSSR